MIRDLLEAYFFMYILEQAVNFLNITEIDGLYNEIACRYDLKSVYKCSHLVVYPFISKELPSVAINSVSRPDDD